MSITDLDNYLVNAVIEDNSELIRSLVNKGADVLAKYKGGTYLHLAVTCKSVDAIKILVEFGIPIDAQDNIDIADGKDIYGFVTPMILAVQNENLNIMELLKSLGADIFWEDCDSFSLMHEAAFCGKNRAIDWLLENGCLIESKGNARNPLHSAASKGHISTIEKLLDLGVDVNTSSSDGWTALHEAAWGGHQDTIVLLISHGANINVSNVYGHMPLHWGAENGSFECVEMLIKHGAIVDAADEKGDTSLHWVAENGNVEVCQVLLNHGASINKTNNALKTPLHIALIKNHHLIVKELLQKGANTKIKDENDKIPIDYSVNDEIKRLFL